MALNGQLVLNVRTALDEDAAQQLTVFTVDWDGCTDQQVAALAARSLVIDRQRKWRKAKAIPGSDSVKVAELLISASGTIATKEGTLAQAKTLSLADQEALLKQLQEQVKAAKAAEKVEAK